ncbi:sodium/potassium-transporting ATPase subunit beta-2-like [Hyla sarda]|uniref:sodium/potassium-transporting ATPase subunit beta-2-like n=1 Tax=Hyla sarda TaxID=327740 RepID=UPI0024C35B53|nr:sodium/potassium-transporting ATPase subunit beta-2-like [Hyla sarda]
MAAEIQKKTCGQIMDEWKECIWNPRTREFMGRTGTSWALILLFYMVFYAFLTAVFTLSMWVMLQTIDEYNPKYSDRLANPGLMIRPKLDAMEIMYSMNTQNASWQKYVDGLNSVLQDYNRSVQEERGTVCTSGSYFAQADTGDVRNYPKKACQFLRDSLGDCSGNNDPTYGYSSGTPCVLIKMNKVINFLPVPVKENSNSSVTISCAGKKLKSALNETNDDLDLLLGTMRYFPSLSGNNLGTIDLMYFPYYGNRAQKNYTQPFVAVKFLNATRNVDHNVECRIRAANINNQSDRDKFQGRVIFTLRIDS